MGELYKEYAISAMLAKFAYATHDTISDLWFKMRDSKRDNFTNVFRGVREVPEFFYDTPSGVQGFSIVKDSILYFVFKGCETNTSKLVPLLEGLKNNRIKVNSDLFNQLNALKGPVANIVNKYLAKIDAVHCIGHSYGGAIATLVAGYISHCYKFAFTNDKSEIKVICHSFGSPRIGNEKYAEWFQARRVENVRIANLHDTVTEMPRSPFYHHVSNAHCIMDNLDVKDLCEKKWYWRLFSAFRIRCFRDLGHVCDEYNDRLMRLYKGNKI
jgi:hypothetical protein